MSWNTTEPLKMWSASVRADLESIHVILNWGKKSMHYRSLYVAQRKIFVYTDGYVYELRKIRKDMHQITGSDCFLEGPYNGMGWWEYLLLGEAHFLTFFKYKEKIFLVLGKVFKGILKIYLTSYKPTHRIHFFENNETHSFYIHWLPSLVLSNEDIKISKKWSLSLTIHC